MTLGKREKVLLGVLAAVFVVLGLRSGLRLLSGDDIGLSLGGSSDVRRATSAEFDLQVEELRLAALDRRTETLVLGRDPFRFQAKPPPPRAKPKPGPKVAPPPAPPKGPVVPRPPVFSYRYMGSFGPKDRKIAVFSDGVVIHNAMTGEVLEEKFIVHHIGFESVDIKFVGFPDEPPLRQAAGG